VNTWVVVFLLATGQHDEVHAMGPFENRAGCAQWMHLYGIGRGLQPWIGSCVTMDEFRIVHPTLKIEGDS
jgi:hypothetical protein